MLASAPISHERQLANYQNGVKSLPRKQAPSQASTRLQSFLSRGVRFLGRFQFLMDHCFNSLLATRQAQVSLKTIFSLVRLVLGVVHQIKFIAN